MTSKDRDTFAHLVGLANTTTDALIAIDKEGLVVSWNKSAEKMFQYSAEKMIGKSIDVIIPSNFKELHEKGLKRVNEGGEHHVIGHSVDLCAMKKDGNEFPISLTLSTWEIDGNKFYGGIIQDISARMETERELNLSERRMRSILEAANDAIITANSSGNILSWNKAAADIFGYQEKEVIGGPLTIIIPEQYSSSHSKGLKRVSEGGEQHVIGKTVELSAVHKEGGLIPIELSISTWIIDNQRYYCGIIRDISERKFHEEIQLANNLKFKSITESANDAIISANEKGIIKSWNRTASIIFGYEKEEVLGQYLTLIIPEKYRALHEAGIKRVAEGGRQNVIGKSVELEGLHKNGNLIPIELSLSTWKVNNKVFYSGIIRNITERKASEAKLKVQKDNLAKKAKELKRLNAKVSSKNEQLQALSNKLAKYLSRQVYTNIFEGKKDVKIESYRKKLTVFFSDIVGFTELTDRVESEILTTALNKYLNEMSKIAIDHGGTIDKYIGDAIMIFFGDPDSLGDKEDAIACVRMAIEMRKKLQDMRREWNALGVVSPLHVRMGINTGFCTVGNFGSEERLDYTIVGSSVNLASRLESAAQIDEILLSQDTFSLINEVIKCKSQGSLKVKGMAYEVNTFLVVDEFETLKNENEQLKAQLKGFNLSIDFDQISYSDKLYAKELLQKAMSKL